MKGLNFKKVTTKAALSDVGVPLAAGVAGAAIGSAFGRGGNIISGVAMGLLSLTVADKKWSSALLAAGVGAAVITPPTAKVGGIDGLEGTLTDKFKAGANSSKGYLKNWFSMNPLTKGLAEKIPVSGLEGLGSMEEAYLLGIEDADTMAGLEGDGDFEGLEGDGYGSPLMLDAGYDAGYSGLAMPYSEKRPFADI